MWSSRPVAGTENDRERDEAAQDQAVAMGPGQRVTIGGQPQVRIAAEQGLEGDPGFEPGQGRAEAVVDPVAEAEVRPVAPADVQDIGGWEPGRIAVGRA